MKLAKQSPSRSAKQRQDDQDDDDEDRDLKDRADSEAAHHGARLSAVLDDVFGQDAAARPAATLATYTRAKIIPALSTTTTSRSGLVFSAPIVCQLRR